MNLWESIGLLLGPFVTAGLGSYFGAYLKRKGENLATHEDMNRLVEQVEATTRATEEIKSQVSGKLWETQERWKLKKDVYVRLIKGLHESVRLLNQTISVDADGTENAVGTADEDATIKKYDAEFAVAQDAVRECYALSTVVSPDLALAIEHLWRQSDQIVTEDRGGRLKQMASLHDAVMKDVVLMARREFAT